MGCAHPTAQREEELQRGKKDRPIQGRMWEAGWEGDGRGSSLGEGWCGAQCCWHCSGCVAVLRCVQSTMEPRDVSAAFVLLEIITESVKLGADHGVNNRVNVQDE